MSFRQPNTSQGSDDFHGLKDSAVEPDFEGVEEKKRKETKKFLFKKDSKDKGYSSLSAEPNQDSVFLVNTKSSKKSKTDNKIGSLSVFKKSFKDEKRLKDIKEEPKRSKKHKERHNEAATNEKEHLFGNYLDNSVASFACNDGVKVPYPIRICMDLIESKGIESEIIYRRSVNKSQLESICDSINTDRIESRLDELNADPNLACAIIKKFLRELKSPLVSDEIITIMDKCDANLTDKEFQTKIEYLKKLVNKMPPANKDTFSYLVMHFYRVFSKHEINKIEIGLFVQKFQPMFRIRERLFKFIITYADVIFSEFRFKRYKTRTDDAISRFSMLPENIEELEMEISKQEAHLANLHRRIASQEHLSDKTSIEQLSDELWALQRYVTSLKRKVKKLKQERKQIEADQLQSLSNETKANQVPASGSNSTIKNEDMSEAKAEMHSEENSANKAEPQEPVNVEELYSKDFSLICENNVLLETLQQLIDKTMKEKSLINDLQQTVIQSVGSTNLLMPIPDTSMLTLQELYDNEQMISNENKLLEERINLINKRINNEKEKIFELKLNIQLKTNEIDQQNMLKKNLDLHLIGKISLPDNKELIMTKL